MIPEVFIENWRKTVPWQMTEQIRSGGPSGFGVELLI
jgi:hypothetical protein